jgi:drug/metabolite transporter (DMT)-like permease
MQPDQSAHQAMNGMSLYNWGILLLLSLLWGGSFFFNGVALQELPVFSIVFGRVFFAALLLLLFMKFKGLEFPTSRTILLSFLFMGLVNNFIPFSLIVAGQAHISSGLASVLNATTPLFTAVVAHVATTDPAERLGPKRIAGITLGIVGVAILLAPKI